MKTTSAKKVMTMIMVSAIFVTAYDLLSIVSVSVMDSSDGNNNSVPPLSFKSDFFISSVM